MNEKRVTCAVMIRDDRLLLARRAPGQKHEGTWEFPGGKVDPGETDQACLAREIREEFGVDGTVGAHLCDVEHTYRELDLRIRLCAYLFSPGSRLKQRSQKHADHFHRRPHVRDKGSDPSCQTRAPLTDRTH